MNNEFFLWPKAQYPKAPHFFKTAPTHAEIEHKLDQLYPNARAVLFSSGRAALHATLEYLGVSRPDLIWCPSYSSHCVFDSISRIGTPTTFMPPRQKVKAALLFHQWGFVHQNNFAKDEIIIEDSADTLFMPGNDIFSANGDFSVVSLPKSLGCFAGGVVFCKNEKDALALDKIRDKRRASYLQFILRLSSAKCPNAMRYWAGAEAPQGSLTGTARNQIMSALENIDALIEDRLEILGHLSENLKTHAEKNGRIACALPLIKPKKGNDLWERQKPLITTGYRNFNTALSAPDTKWKSVAPLPLHKDVTKKILDRFIKKISTKNLKDELGIL